MSDRPLDPRIRDAVPRARDEAEGAHLIPAGERACVWMAAGLISYWLCDLDYRCDSCPLDAALRHLRGARPPQTTTTATGAPPATPPAAPPATDPAAPTALPVATTPSMEVLLDLHLPPLDERYAYHAGHTWVDASDPERVRVGLDPFAVRIAGSPRSVIMPQPGTRLQRGHACAWLDEPGGTLTVLAPLSGTLLEANAKLYDSPPTLAADPFGEGWLLVLSPQDFEAEHRRLASASEFERRLERDVTDWRRHMLHALRTPDVLGPTLADGGAPVASLAELVGAKRCLALAAVFLGTGRVPR